MLSESSITFNYSRTDDQPAGGGQPGWVSALESALKFRLGRLLDAKRLEESTILLPVLSPGYARSERCADELREFLEQAGEDAAGRIFKLVKSPIPRQQHPAGLNDALSYEFFATDPGTGEAYELSPHAAGEAGRRYWARLEDLAFDISRTVNQRERETAVDGEAVFLAESSPDLQEERGLIRRELLQRGLAVLPERPLPRAANELEAQVREQLRRCRLSIHPMGRGYGEIPEGSEESVVALQAELAVERGATGGFSRLLWMPPGLEAEDDRQRRLVERLYTDMRTQAGSDFLITPLERLKVVILNALGERLEPQDPGEPVASVAAGPPQVFLVVDQRDLEASRPLRDYLEGRGFEVALSSFDGDESAIRLDHEEKLRRCDAVVIHWRTGSGLWLHGKLLEVKKSPGLGRTKPPPPTAVYRDAPEISPESFDTGEAQVLTALEGASGLEGFLEKTLRRSQP